MISHPPALPAGKTVLPVVPIEAPAFPRPDNLPRAGCRAYLRAARKDFELRLSAGNFGNRAERRARVQKIKFA